MHISEKNFKYTFSGVMQSGVVDEDRDVVVEDRIIYLSAKISKLFYDINKITYKR